MRLNRGCAVTPAISRSSSRTAASTASSRFFQHGRILHAAQEAARHDLALRHAVRKFRPHPGAGHQAPALLLGNQEAEADGRAREIGGVEPQRHGHRGAVGHGPEQFRQRARPRRPAAPRRCAPRRPPPGGPLPASRRPRGCGNPVAGALHGLRAHLPHLAPCRRWPPRRRPPVAPARLSACGTAAASPRRRAPARPWRAPPARRASGCRSGWPVRRSAAARSSRSARAGSPP